MEGRGQKRKAEEAAIQNEMAQAFLANDEEAMVRASTKMQALKEANSAPVEEEQSAQSIQQEMAQAFAANDEEAMMRASGKMQALQKRNAATGKSKPAVKPQGASMPQGNANLPGAFANRGDPPGLSASQAAGMEGNSGGDAAASQDTAQPDQAQQMQMMMQKMGGDPSQMMKMMQCMQMMQMYQAMQQNMAGSAGAATSAASMGGGASNSMMGQGPAPSATQAKEQFEAASSAITDFLPPEAAEAAKAQLTMQYQIQMAQQAQVAQQSEFQTQMRSWESKQAGKVAKSRFEGGYRPTQLCKKYFLHNACTHGDQCTFAHNYEELHPASAELIDATSSGAALAEQKVEDWETKMPEMRMKKKRELCQKLKNKGKCLLGQNCMFAHTEADLGKVMLVYVDPSHLKTDICWRWEKGNCAFGRYCAHAHGMDQIGKPKPPQEICDMSKPIRPRALTGWTGPG